MGTMESTIAARRILIAAGGTGGHIAPALAVGARLRDRFGDDVLVRFVSGCRDVERQAFEAAHEFPEVIPCERAPRLSLEGAPDCARYARALVAAMGLARRFRPDAVLAMGGYVCAPVLWAARARRAPYYLHESNSVPGKATRLFARGARTVFLAHADAAAMLGARTRAEVVGTPVRQGVLCGDRLAAREALGLDAQALVVGVVGGSQGARALNESMLDALEALAQRAPRLRVVWAAGHAHRNTVEAALAGRGLSERVRLFDFIADMGAFYAASDLVVSRAGASTLAELAATGKPSILVPYPHAADDHQSSNAKALAAAGAAELIPEADLPGARLAEAACAILGDAARLDAMAAAARALAGADAADAICDALMDGPAPRGAGVRSPAPRARAA